VKYALSIFCVIILSLFFFVVLPSTRCTYENTEITTPGEYIIDGGPRLSGTLSYDPTIYRTDNYTIINGGIVINGYYRLISGEWVVINESVTIGGNYIIKSGHK
jgi:hypothetical protein